MITKRFKALGLMALMAVMLFVLTVPQAMAAYSVKQVFTRISVTAGETVTTGQVVMIKDSDGEAYKADANDSALIPAIGVVGSKAGGDGETIEVIVRGILTGWSSLTEGQPGYLSDTAGGVSQTVSTTWQQQVATAVNTTDYMFDFAPKIDAELNAIAGLTSAANKIPYFTGSGAASVISSSANMVSLLASADYSTARTNLGLAIGTNVQAYDAELAALAALTFADDKIILGTGAGTIATADCSVFAQSILDDADEATFKATVNLEPGTDVQAYDAELAALAALTFADDKIILGTGAGTIATADCSVFAQSILDDADEATFKATVNLESGTDVQAYDADLTTYAGITPTAAAQTALGNAADGIVLSQRHRITVAEINAGHEILPAISGKSYRIVDFVAIAYGGAVGTTTTVDILGTQSAGSVKLVTFGQANLTQSTPLTVGSTGVTIQADGASFVACDATTAITVGKTGGDADTATGVDFIITYVIE
jgi:hypothetical protein